MFWPVTVLARIMFWRRGKVVVKFEHFGDLRNAQWSHAVERYSVDQLLLFGCHDRSHQYNQMSMCYWAAECMPYLYFCLQLEINHFLSIRFSFVCVYLKEILKKIHLPSKCIHLNSRFLELSPVLPLLTPTPPPLLLFIFASKIFLLYSKV